MAMPHPRLFCLFVALAGIFFSLAEYPFPELEDLTMESARFEPDVRRFRDRAWLTTFSRQRVYCRSGRSRGLCASPAIRALEAERAQVTVWHNGRQVYQIMGPAGLLMSLDDVRAEGCNAFPLGVLSLVLALACAFTVNWRKLRPGWL
jgi:hypothetical protein